MLKKFLRYSIRTVLALFGLGLVMALAVVLINCHDEDLKPVPSELRVPQNHIASTDNLFIGLVGINAPDGSVPVEFAQKKLAQYEKDFASATPSDVGEDRDIERLKSGELAFHGKIDFVTPMKSSIWNDAVSHKADIQKLLGDNQVLYQRYLALGNFHAYYDTSTPSPNAPFLAIFPSELRKLFLADVTLRIHSRERDEQDKALSQLEADIQTWRTMLAGDGSLIAHMVAISYLHADFLLLADMIADPTLDFDRYSAALESMVAPFDFADWKTGKTMKNEYRFQEVMLQSIDAQTASAEANADSWGERLRIRFGALFFKKNATTNNNAQRFLQILHLSDCDPANFPRARDAFLESATADDGFRIDYIYNPVGKILTNVAVPRYDSYLARSYDEAALQRLVKLGFEIRKQKVTPVAIPAFIAQHMDYASHPVNQRAFSWSADKHEIALTPIDSSSKNRRYEIPIWQM